MIGTAIALISFVGYVSFGSVLNQNTVDTTSKVSWENATPFATLTGHLSDVQSVAFSPDGKILASGSDDNTIKLWRLPQDQ